MAFLPIASRSRKSRYRLNPPDPAAIAEFNRGVAKLMKDCNNFDENPLLESPRPLEKSTREPENHKQLPRRSVRPLEKSMREPVNNEQLPRRSKRPLEKSTREPENNEQLPRRSSRLLAKSTAKPRVEQEPESGLGFPLWSPGECQSQSQSRIQKRFNNESSGFHTQTRDNLDNDERRKWLEEHQDDGTWIKCCSDDCGKWRFEIKYEDAAAVPEEWYCHMCTDSNFNSCAVPEEDIPAEIMAELIEVEYTSGSLVWAHVIGYPWWPAIVANCPVTHQCFELERSKNIPIKYHVYSLDKGRLERSWIHRKDLKSYVNNARQNVVKKMKFRSTDYTKRLNVGCQMADELVPLSPKERLEKLGLEPKSSQLPTGREPAKQQGSRKEQNKFNLGDIVWAHSASFPWWPAIIDWDPELRIHQYRPDIPRANTRYHVIYLNDDEYKYEWLGVRSIKLYATNPRDNVVKKTKFNGKEWKYELTKACKLADLAATLKARTRISMYGVISKQWDFMPRIQSQPKRRDEMKKLRQPEDDEVRDEKTKSNQVQEDVDYRDEIVQQWSSDEYMSPLSSPKLSNIGSFTNSNVGNSCHDGTMEDHSMDTAGDNSSGERSLVSSFFQRDFFQNEVKREISTDSDSRSPSLSRFTIATAEIEDRLSRTGPKRATGNGSDDERISYDSSSSNLSREEHKLRILLGFEEPTEEYS